MTHPDLPYWLTFARVPRIGGMRTALLEAHFDNLREAWHAPRIELQAAGLDDSTIRSAIRARGTVDPEAELAALQAAHVVAFTWHDPEYPPRLKQIDDRPPLLYMRGEIESRDEWSVAVVGTRRVTAYGRQMTEELSRGLASNSVTVVSGLARGVDGIAHRAALDAGGRTIAVVASGLDTVYPPEHKGLAREIAEHGAVLSEQPLGIPPARTTSRVAIGSSPVSRWVRLSWRRARVQERCTRPTTPTSKTAKCSRSQGASRRP